MKTLQTQRLTLRPWQQSDLHDLNEYASVEGVGEMAGWQHHKSLDESKRILDMFIAKDDVYAIVLKESGKVIGSVGLHDKSRADYDGENQREVGFVLSKDYWGQGLTPEAVHEVIRYAFEELDVDVIWCGYFVGNEQSKRVNEKCGFRFWCDENREFSQLGKSVDVKTYIMTKNDYIQKETYQ